jgi:hypothetical protein
LYRRQGILTGGLKTAVKCRKVLRQGIFPTTRMSVLLLGPHLVDEDRNANHGDAIVDSLQDPVHPTVGQEQDSLLMGCTQCIGYNLNSKP